MSVRGFAGGTAALACLGGAAVTFLWQGIIYLQSSAWPKLSLATALRWLDARSWARLAHTWPDGHALLDAIPLSIALVGLAVLAFAVARWGANR